MVAGIVGILTAGVAQFLALLIAGVGHGWGEPFFLSAALWITLPVTAIRLRRPSANSAGAVEWLMVLLALSLDLLLIVATVWGFGRAVPIFGTGVEHFMNIARAAFPLVLLWSLLWFSWQIAALFLLLRRPSKAAR